MFKLYRFVFYKMEALATQANTSIHVRALLIFVINVQKNSNFLLYSHWVLNIFVAVLFHRPNTVSAVLFQGFTFKWNLL